MMSGNSLLIGSTAFLQQSMFLNHLREHFFGVKIILSSSSRVQFKNSV